MKSIKKIYLFLLIIGLGACRKFVEIDPSKQLITTAEIFTNDNTAVAAVDGLYTQMRAATPSYANGGLSVFTGLTSDEIYNTTANTLYDPFYQNLIPSSNGTISGIFWQTPYNVIYRTNTILENLTTATGITDSIKRQLTGETKVVRAMTYFYLVNLYGEVPLVTASDYIVNASLPRATVAQVYQQITSDLLDAQKLLSNIYPSNGKLRPNKMVATALLSRIYLYQRDWINAEAQANTIINSNQYKLVTDLNAVFLINSTETIWEMASPNEAKNAAEGSLFIPASGTVKPAFTINPYLLNAFESGDKRKANWLKSNTVSAVVYNYPYKSKSRLATPITEYEVVCRLAEQYLIRAEARAQQSISRVPEAVSDLNVIRARAGLTSTSPTISQAQCLAAILQERRVELFCESGHRWFDLKRTGNSDAVLGSEKVGWQPYMGLYPIPFTQIQYNPNLTQNIGYN